MADGTQSEMELRREIDGLRRRLSRMEDLAAGQSRTGLSDDELRYRFLYEENPSMYFTVDARGVVRSVNPFGAEQLGYEVDELVGAPVLDVFHDEDKEAVQREFRTCLERPGETFDWEFRKIRKDGVVMWVRELARVATDWTGESIVLIVCEDITHRKAVEQALRGSRESYRTLYTRTPVMLHSIDVNRRLLDVSDYWLEALGYERDEVIGRKVTEFMTAESKTTEESQSTLELYREGKRRDVPRRFVKKDGEVIDVRLSAIAEHDGSGKFVRSLTVLIDVTRQTEVEDALRLARDELERRVLQRTSELEAQRRFLRQVIDVDPNFVFAKDRDGRFTLVNKSLAEAYGTTVEELTGKCDADFNPNADEVEFFRKMDVEVMDTHEPRLIPEEQITDSSGCVRWLQTIKSPLFGEDGVANQVLGSATDITARKQAEEALRAREAELRQSQRELRNLAGRLLTAQEDERRRLAREMHDDVSQRLAVLAIQAGRIEGIHGISEEELKPQIGKLRAGLQELSTDVHDLSRRLHPSILEDLGLVDALEAECVGFMQRERIRAHFKARDVPGDLPREVSICLYRIVQEGLRNIAKHAATDQAWVTLTGVAGSLVLEIRDPGVGFELSRAHPRTGLGLSSMEERARLIQAELSLESSPAKGTRIEVRVPLDPGAASESQ